jgi:hypothetical protein
VRLSALHTYPIKGCRRLDHETAVVEPWGLAGDRRWLITRPDGVAITQRDIAALALLRAIPADAGLSLGMPGRDPLLVPPLHPDPSAVVKVWSATVAATPAGVAADAWLSAALGQEVQLVWLDDPTRRAVNPEFSEPGDRVNFADGYPVLLTNTASLARLNDWIFEGGSDEGPLPMARFRPNVVVDGAEPFAEDDWIGKRIRIGEVTFRAPKPCGRCVVTTTDQETGERGREPLRTLARHRNVDTKLLFGLNLIPDAPGQIRVGDSVSLA